MFLSNCGEARIREDWGRREGSPQISQMDADLVFNPPSTFDQGMEFVESIRDRPNFVPVAPGNRHWGIFRGMCQDARAKGNLVPDAYHAALAVESGSEWVTTDSDFRKFTGLRWVNPLDE